MNKEKRVKPFFTSDYINIYFSSGISTCRLNMVVKKFYVVCRTNVVKNSLYRSEHDQNKATVWLFARRAIEHVEKANSMRIV